MHLVPSNHGYILGGGRSRHITLLWATGDQYGEDTSKI